MGKRQIIGTIISLLGLTLLPAHFTNCTRVKNSGHASGSSEDQALSGGGGGYDGKVYNFQRFDEVRCSDLSANGQPAPNAVIRVSPQQQSALVQLVRENCAPISPVTIPSAEYTIVPDGSILYKSRAYVAETPNTFAPIGFTSTAPQGQSYWGGAECIMDTLWNSEIGNGGKVASQRFRAPYSGAIATVKTFFSDGAGSRGTGGTVRVRVYPDDGSADHLPNLSGGIFAEGLFVPGLVNGNYQTDRRFTEISMTSRQPLVAGNLYHVYYENTDPNSAQNFISLESQATGPAHGRPCRFLSPTDWGITRSQYTTALTDMTQTAQAPGYFVPILQVRMAAGEIFGNANVDGGNFSAQIHSVRVGQPVRTRITPVALHNLNRIMVQTAASIAGSLTWTLREGAAVLATGSISEPVANYREGVLLDVGGAGFYEWYDLLLPPMLTLQPGRIYDLEFSVSDASEWKFAAHVDGSANDFSAPAVSTETRAERWNGTSWIGFDVSNPANNGRANQWRVIFQDQVAATPQPQSNLLYNLENAGLAHSFSALGPRTFRHEVRAGDRICPGGVCEPSERSEISLPGSVTDANSVMTVSYDFTAAPGPVSTAGWMVVGSFSIRNSSPEWTGPIEIAINPGDQMAVIIGWLSANPSSLTPSWNATLNGQPLSFAYAFTDTAPIQRGRTYAMKIEARLHPQSGFVRVYRDGVIITNYTGPVGFNQPTVWRSGIWRQGAAETFSAVFGNLQVTR